MAVISKPPHSRTPRLRILALLAIGLTLALGTITALLRINAAAPVSLLPLSPHHGSLMILGFVGGAISLERAVALRRCWAYLSPGCIISGTAMLVLLKLASTSSAVAEANLLRSWIVPGSRLPVLLGSSLYATGFLLLTIIYYYLWLRRRDEAVLIQTLGAVCGIIASLLLVRSLSTQVQLPYLLFFPIFTIIGERLELSLVRKNASSSSITALCFIIFFTLNLGPFYPNGSLTVAGILLLALCLLSGRADIARHTLAQPAIARFSAVGILSGYVWLSLAGSIWVLTGATHPGPLQEILVHAVTVGFVMPMIFAHAPIIIPAITHRSLPYHPVLWVPLIIIQVGLAIRFGIGIARGIEIMRIWGGTLNVAAIASFAVILVFIQNQPMTSSKLTSSPKKDIQ